MKKQLIFALGIAMALFTGCTMTHQNKNLMKEPNGNIRVETATIKRFVPVSYTYETNVTSCSEVAFLTHVTKEDPSINNIYEIHWNQVENHKNFMGFKSKKKYTCEFWGVGIQYGDPLPRSASSQTVVTVPAAPAAPAATVPATETVSEATVPTTEAAPAETALNATQPVAAESDSVTTQKN